MGHVKALLIKIIVVGILGFLIFLSMEEYLIGPPFFLLLSAAVVSYFIGDLVLLPLTNNAIATALDIVIWWTVGTLIIGDHVPILATAIIAPIIVGVGEWYFHKYMLNVVLPGRTEQAQ